MASESRQAFQPPVRLLAGFGEDGPVHLLDRDWPGDGGGGLGDNYPVDLRGGPVWVHVVLLVVQVLQVVLVLSFLALFGCLDVVRVWAASRGGVPCSHRVIAARGEA